MDATAAFRDEATDFKSRWAKFASDRGLADPADDPAVAKLRRDAIEFFSWGLVHGEYARRRIEQLLPIDGPPRLRLVGN